MANSFGYRWRPPTDRSVFCLEKPVQITAPMLSSADGGSFVFSSNALNGAKRLNGWNDLNGHRYCLARVIDLFLEAQFQLEKPASKLLNRAYFASFLS